MTSDTIRDLKKRNEAAREAVSLTSKEAGITFTHMAKILGSSPSSFLHWKGAKYNYGIEKLKEVESIIDRYNFD